MRGKPLQYRLLLREAFPASRVQLNEQLLQELIVVGALTELP